MVHIINLRDFPKINRSRNDFFFVGLQAAQDVSSFPYPNQRGER